MSGQGRTSLLAVSYVEHNAASIPWITASLMTRNRFRSLAFAALAQLTCAASSAQTVDIGYLASPGAPVKAFPPFERPVADIISPHRSTEAKRDANEEAQQLARLMRLKPGMIVGDIGAGSGYFTVRLAGVVGPSGAVVAQDVRRDYLTYLARRIQGLQLTNVKVALGEPHDPRLPKASLDAAILVHMYHEIAEPYAFLYNLASALKPGARVGIVDLDRPTPERGTPPKLLRCELAAVGYREVSFHVLTGDAGYLGIFEPPAKRPRPSAIVPCRQ
jgi:SAM-dependent methyltransferase